MWTFQSFIAFAIRRQRQAEQAKAFAESLSPIVSALAAEGISFTGIAAELNKRRFDDDDDDEEEEEDAEVDRKQAVIREPDKDE